MSSSSGGAFTALSDVFLEEGNAVVCAVYDYISHRVLFRIVDSREQRDLARGSKYLQAEMGSVYRDSVSWLAGHPEGKLLFFGLGCQAAAFQRYMETARCGDRVVTADIICHGAPSPRVWRDYVQTVAPEGGLTGVNFRDKKTGWAHSVGTAVVNGEEISIQDYRRLYSSRNTIRPSCFSCPYTKMDRGTDLTIGDFWHIEKSMPDFNDPKGVSLVILHTDRGRELFQKASGALEYRLSNERECWQLNLEKPTAWPGSRDRFWKDYRDRGPAYAIAGYSRKKTMPARIMEGISRVLGS